MGKYSLMPSGRFYIHLILLTGPFPFFLKMSCFAGEGGGGGGGGGYGHFLRISCI